MYVFDPIFSSLLQSSTQTLELMLAITVLQQRPELMLATTANVLI